MKYVLPMKISLFMRRIADKKRFEIWDFQNDLPLNGLRMHRFSKENVEASQPLLNLLQRFADEKGIRNPGTAERGNLGLRQTFSEDQNCTGRGHDRAGDEFKSFLFHLISGLFDFRRHFVGLGRILDYNCLIHISSLLSLHRSHQHSRLVCDAIRFIERMRLADA